MSVCDRCAQEADGCIIEPVYRPGEWGVCLRRVR